ncbi:MAG: malectin domain-containing carbohydrate-binding protein [Terracidiphilus sp.]|nr:malectin domain-containing carbohydrate-binding protein [Terracidiphilus sp.]
MTVERPETPDLECCRAALKTVLESKYFRRAPKLAHLLAYVCEKSFAGEAHQIKEYSIGVEVFHRGSSFDQDSDSIVRVEANRLRRQLAEYYASEGATHPLRITIPLGQYVPEFAWCPPSQTGNVTAAELPSAVHLPGDDPSARHQAKRLPYLFGRWTWWIVGGAAIVLLSVSGGLFLLRRHAPPAVAGNPPPAEAAEVQIGPPAGEGTRILCGSNRSFVDHAGKLWSADTGFEGGSAVKSAVEHIWRTQDPGFYRTSRQGQFRYRIPLQKGIYELRLHFAETVYGPESSATGGEGSRIFSVRANGKILLSRFDIAADAGASRTADVKVFTDVQPAADGFLSLEFFGEGGAGATLSAIEILPGLRRRIRPVRLLARQTPYYSNDSHWWSPDNYFEGGQMASYSTPVNGTGDPELYETERWGNFSYSIPVSPGKYSITLHFAVRHGNWDQPFAPSEQNRAAVAHLFNVFCNGNEILKNFNLAKEARATDVVIRKFSGVEPNAQGKLLLNFVPVEGYATITGIEVLPE